MNALLLLLRDYKIHYILEPESRVLFKYNILKMMI